MHKKNPSPFHTAPVKKKHKSLGLTGIIDQSIDLSTPDFKTGLKREREKKKKKRDRGNKKIKILVPYGSMLHIPPTNSLLLAAKQEPYKTAYHLTKILNNFLERNQENGPAERKKDGKSNRSQQKNKRRDSKVESNNSPEIPDRGETYIPSLPSGEQMPATARLHMML